MENATSHLPSAPRKVIVTNGPLKGKEGYIVTAFSKGVWIRMPGNPGTWWVDSGWYEYVDHSSPEDRVLLVMVNGVRVKS